MQRRILMVLGVDFLIPFVDGRVLREARSLIAAGHEVTILCWARTLDNKVMRRAPQEQWFEGIRVLRVQSPIASQDVSPVVRLYQHLKAMSRLAAVVRREEADVLYCHDFNTLFVLPFIPLHWRPPLVIYDSHEDYINMVDEVLPRPLVRVAHGMQRLLMRNGIHTAVSVCQPILDGLEAVGARRTALVMNCRPWERAPTTAEAAAAAAEVRHRWALPAEKRIMCYIGSLGDHRGLEELLEFFRDPPQDWHLLFGGNGHRRDDLALTALNMRHVSFMGYVPHDQVRSYTAGSDLIYCMFDPDRPSQRICMPNKLCESMMWSTPVVVARGTLAAEVVERWGNGITARYGDLDDLRNACATVEKASEVEKMVAAGAAAAEAEFNWEAQEERLLDVVQS